MILDVPQIELSMNTMHYGTSTMQTIHKESSETEKSYNFINDSFEMRNNTWGTSNAALSENNSTPVRRTHYNQDLEDKLNQLIHSISEEVFEESDENTSFIILFDLLNKYGDIFDEYMESRNLINQYDTILTSRLLAKLGAINGQLNCKKSIEWILKYCLYENDPKIRYGALLGLSYIKSPKLLATLEYAITLEDNPILKEDISNLISQIKS